MKLRSVLLLAAFLALATAAQAAASPSARVWVTTPDQSMRLSDRGSVDFRDGGSNQLTITVDTSREYQEMEGFGASITDSSAHVLYRLDRRTRDATMRRLFRDNRLSVLRQPMGASDFVAGDHYTYDDLPPGRTDYDMSEFSIAHDRAQILPLLRRARALNPRLKVVASPWSAPAWMKTNGSLVGGRLIDDPRIYAAYARYFVKFVHAYRREGVPVHAVTVQNEPQNRRPSGYPGMDLPVAQEAKLIVAIGRAFRDARLKTRILGYDHNWSMHPDDIASTPPGEEPETEYAADLLRSEAARYVDGTAFHCYFGDPSRQTDLHRAFPEKEIWFTECSGSHGPTDPPARMFSDTLRWHARNLVLGVTRNWGETVVNWNLALDPSGGPHNGGCDTCTGVVTVGPGNAVTENAEYHTLGHLARFVEPGATRIASTSFGTTGWNGQVMDAAFRNRDGRIALVVHNENDDPRTFAVAQAGRSFEYTLPGGALATFTWDAFRDRHELLGAERMSATAPELVDDDATTRWTTGAPQQPGQAIEVDLGRRQKVARVVLDTGVDTGDFPRGYELHASRDGDSWERLAAGAGQGQLTTIDFRATEARFLRVVQNATAPQWWSVADLRVYR